MSDESNVLVITGASDGIGKALAQEFAKEYTVVGLARNEQALQKLAKKTGCDWMVCDVKDSEQVAKVFDEIAAKHGRIDIVVNNAGVIVNGDLVDTPYEDITNVMQTNSLGGMYVSKAALKQMKSQKNGLLINVISTAGLTARPNRSMYNASKWAMTGFTKAIQQEAADYGVKVTALYPGTVNTKLFEKAGLNVGSNAMSTDEIVRAVGFILTTKDTTLVAQLELRPAFY